VFALLFVVPMLRIVKGGKLLFFWVSSKECSIRIYNRKEEKQCAKEKLELLLVKKTPKNAMGYNEAKMCVSYLQVK